RPDATTRQLTAFEALQVAPTAPWSRERSKIEMPYNLAATGVTGRAWPQLDTAALSVKRIRRATDLPIITGFGVRTPEHAAAIGKICDGVVVGSLFSEAIEVAHERQLLTSLPTTVEALASGIRAAIQIRPLCTEW
ncbi:tryptophan synthase subunit alpha, partial [Paracoccus sp. P2]|uniref:tryptophan synthase subunit alpha n=1 Tax=Paracoccus sp. P2 TaxID=3248840 RepID=UPI00391FBBDB